MPWDENESYSLGIDCAGPSSTAKGPWVTLGTKGLCSYTVHRTDSPGGMLQRWFVDVLPSTNQAREGIPQPRYMLEGTEEVFTFPVEGVHSFRIRVGNAEAAPTETVQTDHYWRKDGLDL